MIISKTPFRVSLFGGGTDYPQWFKKNGGMTIGGVIDKYCYVMVRKLPPFFKYKTRIRYSNREEVNNIDDIKHPSVRECLKFMNVDFGVEIIHTADIPAKSGIGSSSAFTVGLLKALYEYYERDERLLFAINKRELAMNAIKVEQEFIKEFVGCQDQILVSYGGFNQIKFYKKGSFQGSYVSDFEVIPMEITKERKRFLEKRLMLFFTGFSRFASDVAKEQIQDMDKKQKELQSIYDITLEALSVLNNVDIDLRQIGILLNKSWAIKKTLTKFITTVEIDSLYEKAISYGAIGGKLIGAGGGGFLLLYVEPYLQENVKKGIGLLHVPFRFVDEGSVIINS